MFLLTMHPHISGHRSRIVALEQLIAHIEAKGAGKSGRNPWRDRRVRAENGEARGAEAAADQLMLLR